MRRHPVLKAESPDLFYDATTQALQVVKGEKSLAPNFAGARFIEGACALIRPGLAVPCSSGAKRSHFPEDELAMEWDKVALTPHEEVLRRAMRIVTPDFQNLAFVRNRRQKHVISDHL